MFGAKLCVHYWEVVPCSEGPLSEVPLYRIHVQKCLTTWYVTQPLFYGVICCSPTITPQTGKDQLGLNKLSGSVLRFGQ